MNTKSHVLTVGAGTGHRMVLKSLKSLPLGITAVLNVTDNGGHTGALREEYGIPAVGDLRQCASALITDDHLMKSFLENRFSSGSMAGQQLGNLMLTALLREGRSFSQIMKAFSRRYLEPEHKVLPVSNDSGQIGCKLKNGERYVGEWDIIGRDSDSPIDSIFHEPELSLVPDIKNEVRKSDALIISPGNLHTGVLSCLLTGDFSEVLKREDLPVIYICNLLTFPPLTKNDTAADHLDWIENILDQSVDTMLFSSNQVPEEALNVYQDQYKATRQVQPGDIPERVQVIEDDFATTTQQLQNEEGIRAGSEKFKSTPHLIRHHPGKLTSHLKNLLLEPQST